MPSKYDMISALAAQRAHGISASPTTYMAFLKAAAMNYKYSFDDQLLIFAQKPNATACADIQTWNRLGRWVNRGTKGIALLAPAGSTYKLRHVFDLSDTNSYARQNVKPWRMERRHQGALAESLQNSFGTVESNFDFAEFLQKIAEQVVEDNYPDYLLELENVKAGSLLEELDDLNTKVWFKTALKASVAYMLLTRCGLNAEQSFGAEDFSHVYDFNTLETISILGAATSDVSEMLLREVERTVREENRRTFEKSKEPRHNEHENNKNEGSFDHGTDLSNAGGLSSSEPDRAGEPENREVWDAAADLSAAAPQRSLHRDAYQREAEGASGGDRPSGDRDAGAADDAAGEGTGRDRDAESLRPDAVGDADEQHPQLGGGDGADRADLPVIDDLPTVEEQQNIIAEAEEDKTSAFAISQEDIDAVLLSGSAVSDGKLRIYEQFLKKESREDNVRFLKREYGIGGAYPVVADRGLDEAHDAKGIRISRGSVATPDGTLLLKWNKVEKRIGELIDAGRYLSPPEAERYPAYRAEKETQEARRTLADEVHPTPAPAPEKAAVVREQLRSHEDLIPPPAPTGKRKLAPHMLYPEIKSEYRTNFRIRNEHIGEGTPTERFFRNLRAIQLLKKLEREGRLADSNEQDFLSEYVGWGGLSEFFQEINPHYGELKELLTEEEYSSARESTLTAFYTPPVVIKAILENIGFQTGNVLEPSCGIGNFMGLLPDSMSSAKLYGVELDSISGRIARQLYQNASIAVQGYEKAELPDSFFDVALGNVPFGQFKVMDKKYDRYNFLIHDYFFARTLDKVRPGGIIAFITSKGTLDKENPNVRKYIAQRADLLGAIRLPDNTFKAAAGTEVTSDIIFLQKRDRLIDRQPDWVHLGTDENGVRMNSYFVQNPDMILGDMKMVSGPFGSENACIAYKGSDLGDLLAAAIENIHAEYVRQEIEDVLDADVEEGIPADPNVRNFSYTVVDGKLYYRENSVMNPVDMSVTAANRIKGMTGIRDCVRELIEVQTEDYPDVEVKAKQDKLNQLYDSFAAKYGRLNDRANKTAFLSDSSFCLLSALEVLDDEGHFTRKADMFTKRTIKQRVVITHVDTATEAFAVSMAEKARVDMPYMTELTGKSEEEIAADLRGVVFLNPEHTDETDGKPKYLPADEYLSGNVREKLALAEKSAALYPDEYASNVEALKAVQPVDLTASEISVRLGATWLPTDVIQNFMFTLLDTPRYQRWSIKVHYSAYTGEWNIEGKSRDSYNIKAYNTYGTDRINAYKIIEDTLNLRDVRIFDYVVGPDGKRTPVLNKKETAIAQGKQEAIKQAFEDWIWADSNQRDVLCRLYNEKFNSFRPREYDGSHLSLVGINPEIALRLHQLNAVARGLYGGNELLGHVVGAGKTFTMVAIAQESKRLGLCQKSLIVVPNHLTEQWAAEYLQLYPSANILVATRKDFEARNRKRFCGRIATGDYDAIIIGHSQLEKIPMSVERQQYILQQQMDEIMEGIIELKHNRGDKFSIKQLEKSKKAVQQKLDRLNDQSRKDDLVTFEDLGVDRLFIDEAHYYKNLAAFTKMRNVSGISQTEAQKSSDLYMKCRYLDEITGGRGVVFATGTPISNRWWRCTRCRNIFNMGRSSATVFSILMPGHPPSARPSPP